MTGLACVVRRGLVLPVLLVTGKVCAHHRLPQLPSHG